MSRSGYGRSAALALERKPQGNRRVKVPWWTSECIGNKSDDTFWITGGLGSGKSYGAAIWFLERCFRNARSNYSWAVAPAHSKVKDILIATFHDVLRDVYNMQFRRDYDVLITQPATLKFRDIGHEVIMHSGMRPDLMIGSNISHYWITEAGTQKAEIYEKCQTRARCPRAKVIQGMLEGTPEGENWYCEHGNFDEYDEARKARRYILWTEDNKHLPDNYVDKMRRTFAHDPAKLESYLFGVFKPFGKSTAYWDFVDSRNITLDVSAAPELPILLTWDWNRSPLAWVAAQKQIRWDRLGNGLSRIVALHTSSGTSRGLRKACAEFVALFDPAIYYNCPIYIHGDASGWAGSHQADSCSFDEVKRLLTPHYREVVVRAERSNPRVRDRLENFAKNCAYANVVVAAWCRRLIESLHRTQLKPGTWEILKDKDDIWSHYGDAFSYLVYDLTKDEEFEFERTPVKGLNVPQ